MSSTPTPARLSLSSAEFRSALKVWARDQGIRGVPADNTLKRKLEGLGLKVKLAHGYNKVYGLGLKA